MALPNYTAYAASKAGVDAITRAAAVALAPFGVLVNSVAPGMMDTEMQRITEAELARVEGRSDLQAFLDERTRRIPLGRRAGIADLLAALYFHELRYDPQNLAWPDRDRFLLSTGHYSIALWAALAECGIIPVSELSTYGADGSRLDMSTLDTTPGVEVIGGSLGHGLGQGVGQALGLRMDGRAARVFVELS